MISYLFNKDDYFQLSKLKEKGKSLEEPKEDKYTIEIEVLNHYILTRKDYLDEVVKFEGFNDIYFISQRYFFKKGIIKNIIIFFIFPNLLNNRLKF